VTTTKEVVQVTADDAATQRALESALSGNPPKPGPQTIPETLPEVSDDAADDDGDGPGDTFVRAPDARQTAHQGTTGELTAKQKRAERDRKRRADKKARKEERAARRAAAAEKAAAPPTAALAALPPASSAEQPPPPSSSSADAPPAAEAAEAAKDPEVLPPDSKADAQAEDVVDPDFDPEVLKQLLIEGCEGAVGMTGHLVGVARDNQQIERILKRDAPKLVAAFGKVAKLLPTPKWFEKPPPWAIAACTVVYTVGATAHAVSSAPPQPYGPDGILDEERQAANAQAKTDAAAAAAEDANARDVAEKMNGSSGPQQPVTAGGAH